MSTGLAQFLTSYMVQQVYHSIFDMTMTVSVKKNTSYHKWTLCQLMHCQFWDNNTSKKISNAYCIPLRRRIDSCSDKQPGQQQRDLFKTVVSKMSCFSLKLSWLCRLP